MKKTSPPEQYAEFGEHAEFIELLLHRIETCDDPFMGLEGILAFNFSETPDAQLDRLIELADARERAWEASVAEKEVAHQISQRRGCVGQVLAALRVPLPEPLPFVPPSRPKYGALRSIVAAAKIQKAEEALLLEELGAVLRGDEEADGASSEGEAR